MTTDRRGTLNILNNALLLIVFICCSKLNKPRCLTSDEISITLNINCSFDTVVESCTLSSLFIFKTNRVFVLVKEKKKILTLLSLLCVDIERCPGQPSITAFSKQGGMFVHQTICGLLNEIPQLETFFSDTLSKIEIISLSEMAPMAPQIMTNSINYQAIHLLRKTEKNGLSDGVGIFLKNRLNYKLWDDL